MAAAEIATTDYHTAGEPFRIVVDGAPQIPGATVRDRREQARHGADLGVVFWHKDGYSTACGHGTIALGAWAVESRRVAAEPDGVTDVTIDVPSGRVVAAVRCRDGVVESVAFR